MIHFSKPIGIIGGAGPVASAYLYKLILETCQKKYGSNDYHEFPEILIDSFPFTRGDGEKIRRDIAFCIQKLKSAGAKIFCLASNSFHGFLPDPGEIRFIHLIHEGLGAAKEAKIHRALILAAQKTIDLKLYEQGSVLCEYPSKEDQAFVHGVIRDVAGGAFGDKQAEVLKKIIEKHAVDGVILACTELPLVHRASDLSKSLPVIDTLQVLAEKLIANA